MDRKLRSALISVN